MAAEADDQEALLEKQGTAPSADELALVFSDALRVASEQLPESARLKALQLDRYLEKISGSENAELWTVHALRSRAEWVHVRQLAKSVLQLLGEDDP